MRQARVIRYLVVAALLLLLAACGQFPGMRTNMPPTPAETPPGAAAPAPARPRLPPRTWPNRCKTWRPGCSSWRASWRQPQGRTGRPRRLPRPGPCRPPPPPVPPRPAAPAAPAPGRKKIIPKACASITPRNTARPGTSCHQYLKNQPKGPKAPEARYYLADSFYQEGKYQEAGVEFNKLRLQFPKSILAPAGLLRQALCYKNQQQMGTYRSTLQKLVKAYPNSPEAKEAQKMLKESPKQAVR